MSIWSRLKGRKTEEKHFQPVSEPAESQHLIREIAKEIDSPLKNRAGEEETPNIERVEILEAEPGSPSTERAEKVVSEMYERAETSKIKRRCVLEPEMYLQGALYLSDGDEIQGSHTGEVYCDGTLLIAESASVDAVVQCDSIRVYGTVNGQIVAGKTVQITKEAQVHGSITTPELEVEPGAIMKGTLEMTGS